MGIHAKTSPTRSTSCVSFSDNDKRQTFSIELLKRLSDEASHLPVSTDPRKADSGIPSSMDLRFLILVF